MEMYLKLEDGTQIEYDLVPEEPEQLYYETIKFKKSHIKIKTKVSREQAAEYRELILNEINSEKEKRDVETKPVVHR